MWRQVLCCVVQHTLVILGLDPGIHSNGLKTRADFADRGSGQGLPGETEATNDPVNHWSVERRVMTVERGMMEKLCAYPYHTSKPMFDPNQTR